MKDGIFYRPFLFFMYFYIIFAKTVNMSAFNGEKIGSSSKDLVLVTGGKVYVQRGSTNYEIDLDKLKKLLDTV